MIDDSFTVSPVCNRCKHLISQSQRRCAAFDVIPTDIWQGMNAHTSEVEGDGGIRFEPSEEWPRFRVEPP